MKMSSRYLLAHKLLPQYAFSKNKRMAIVLRNTDIIKQFVESRWDDAQKLLKEESEEIDVEVAVETVDNVVITTVKMPICQSELDADCVVYVHNHDKVLRYFTLEISSNNMYFMCEWDKNGGHINYGGVEASRVIEKVRDILKNQQDIDAIIRKALLEKGISID